MKNLIQIINESIAFKKELSEFEKAWLDWLNENGKEGHLPNEKEDIKERLIQKAKKEYDYEIDQFEGDVDYYFIEDLIKLILKKKDWFKIPEEYLTKSKLYKYLKPKFDNEYLEVVMKEIVANKDEWNKWYDNYLMNRFFSDFGNDLQVDKKTGLLKICRSISIPKNTFKKEGYSNYKEWIDNYFEGLGIYWSFGLAGVYCFQEFDDDSMSRAGNTVTLDIYGLVNYDSIDIGTTFKQLSGNFGSEQEITIINDAPIEVYKIIIKDKSDKEYKLPLKKSVICKA